MVTISLPHPSSEKHTAFILKEERASGTSRRSRDWQFSRCEGGQAALLIHPTTALSLAHPGGILEISRSALRKNKKAEAHLALRLFKKNLAVTYSRGIYKTTTIGKTAFDGRVRDGIGSGHSFI